MKSTAIECKLIREGGTYADIGGIEYHFSPRPDGAHVADIEDQDHVDVFLSAPEGYRLYRGEVVTPAAPVEVAQEVAPEESEVDERAVLAVEYEALYGEAPHARTGIKRLRELIAAKQTV